MPLLQTESVAGGDPQLTLVGWQARIVPGLPALAAPDAKYLSAAGMKKSELLYGLHRATESSGPVYLVEGPVDVWRVGPGGLAMLGKNLSRKQAQLVARHFADRPIVVLLDADAVDESATIQRQLRQACGASAHVVIAHLPTGRADPGDCTREELQQAGAVALGQSLAPIG